MKKIKNKENGITIVSLVVTIMIMLILTGISINGSFALPIPSKEEDTFVGWNTKQDGSGTMFSPDEEIDELQINDGETITLYAQWKNYVYCLDNANFDGTANSIIDTEICLFNDENVNKNFRIKFTVEDYDESYNDPANVSDNNSYPTIMSAMYEKASPFQGFVFRIMNNKNTSAYQLRLNNTTTGEFNNTYKLQKSLDVDLIRENGAMYFLIVLL